MEVIKQQQQQVICPVYYMYIAFCSRRSIPLVSSVEAAADSAAAVFTGSAFLTADLFVAVVLLPVVVVFLVARFKAGLEALGGILYHKWEKTFSVGRTLATTS